MMNEPLSPPIGPPGPWGDRRLGVGAGLQPPPNTPKLSPMGLEGRITRIEGAAVAAFVFLLVAFGSGYVLLSNQQAANTAAITGKLDTLSAQVADVKTDVAVLKERTASKL